jgi:NADPH-dependent ferric siderophore reductase
MTRHAITKIRHELRRRTLTVASIEDVTPGMRRVHFSSPDLADFNSAGFDDHVKMFIPGPGAEGPATEAERPAMRDFTPRLFDTGACTLALDYAMHDAGPAIDWAKTAKPGDTLEIGGPRGSAVMTDDFDWYWFIGDETALPAIGRRLEELRAGVPVATFVAVDSAQEAQAIATATRWTPEWVVRDGRDDAAALIAATEKVPFPEGEGFVWIAAEAMIARAVRAAIEARGHPRAWLKASGYWQRGDPGVHIRIED